MNGPDLLCPQATTGCPDPTQFRFWVYTRVYDRALPPEQQQPFRQVTDPPYRCAGPQEAQLDPLDLIPGLVAEEFARVVVLRGVAEVSPTPRTLVNVATRFETPTVERYDIPLTLLGQDVVITAQAERWTWHTGDGRTVSTERKGTRGRVEHVYRHAGQRTAHVVITWSGTYSVNGQAMGAIPGTVTTQGEPVAVDVREARTELVSG